MEHQDRQSSDQSNSAALEPEVFSPQIDSDLVLSDAPEHQRILLPINCTRAQAVATLNKRAPTNEYGFPAFFVRSDLLPSSLQTLTQREVDNASEGLFYWEGYPTLNNGTTFWHQLPHEPYEPYILFTKYIEQAETVGIRQLDLLAVANNEEGATVMGYYHEYAWNIRARAHDIFSAAAEQKRRQLITRKTENKHFDNAGALFDKLLGRFQGENADWIDELNAKEAVEVLETLVKIQRLSLGLTGSKSSTASDIPEGADTETLIRQLTRGANSSNAQEVSVMDKLRALTSSEEEGMRIQEAIVRIGYAGNKQGFNDQTGLA